MAKVNDYLQFMIICLFMALLVGGGDAKAKRLGFEQWVNVDLWPEAREAGVSQATFQKALKGIKPNFKMPDLVIPGRKKGPRKQRQSEFASPSRYFKPARMNGLVKAGRLELKKWQKSLDAIESRYGVPRGILLAVWARESAFGKARMRHNTIQALSTLAYTGRRAKYFRSELIAALVMLEKKYATLGQMRSSWAGALGQPQFMPTVFLKYAVDFDGDGRKDIWHSVPDSLASIAHFFSVHGWDRTKPWGYEVTVPKKLSCALEGPDKRKAVTDWIALGIERVKGRKFSNHSQNTPVSLLMPAGRLGPAFLVTKNFYVIKSFNESDLYALFVGHVADRLNNNKSFVKKWATIGKFPKYNVKKMQIQLVKQGHDVGGADGLVGFKTRRSIGLWQERQKLQPTCFPNQQLIQRFQ